MSESNCLPSMTEDELRAGFLARGAEIERAERIADALQRDFNRLMARCESAERKLAEERAYRTSADNLISAIMETIQGLDRGKRGLVGWVKELRADAAAYRRALLESNRRRREAERAIEYSRDANTYYANSANAAREREARLEKALKQALSAFDLIEWMACEYADAGGSGGPEKRTYDDAVAEMKKARAALGDSHG